MIKTGFETRVKVQQVIENQLPEFLRSESPKAVDFLKQYYISQEYQGGTIDLANNLDQYLKLDNLSPEVIQGQTTLSVGISTSDTIVQVATTKGFPAEYGLFKIDNEIFTYTGITTNTFTGCVRGFSGITSYRSQLNAEELVFSTSKKASHTSGTTVKNLSVEFLKEFYKKLKYSFTPGLENVEFTSNLDVNNFIKEARSLYQSKGTEESYRILFNVIFGVTPKVVDLEDYLIKPSTSEYLRREVVVAERISGDPNKLIGQTIKKSSDEETQASVSEVEIFTRSGITTYYKLNLFVGYDEKDLIEGTFNIQPKTKVINPVSVGASVVTVDSTIGFSTSGTLISGDNTITYTEKTVNQFLGCSGISNAISTKDEIRTNETFIGYEGGDTSKKVEIRITGVISDFEQKSDILLSTEGQRVYVKNVGEKIQNPESNKTYKQIFANSWIYNTSSRYQILNISGSAFELKSNIDKSGLKVGDSVDILQGNTETIAHSNAVVATVSGNTVTLNNLSGFTPNASLEYTLRRKLKTATSSGTPLLYGNNVLTSDVQNVYVENDDYYYVASNSLPSYEITRNIKKATLSSASGTALQGFNTVTEKYDTLSFSSSVPFITGDKIVYSASNDALSGMPEGVYYVKVLSPNNKIKLYLSRSLIEIDTPVEFTSVSATGSHTFVLVDQENEQIYPQKILKKFPSATNIKTGNKTLTRPGATGLLINGVEILNYKSEDKIYYGPISKLQVYNGGSEYDVINPPTLTIASPGVGTTALARPVVTGVIKDVLVDPQSFDVNKVISATIEGGNGSGAILKPIVETRYREIEFNGSSSITGGAVDYTNDVIAFSSQHNLNNGDSIVYNRNGNTAIGIGTFGGSNASTGETLVSGSVYYVGVENSTSIKLYESRGDYLSGINTVGFTTATSQGIHKFKTFEPRKTLTSIKVLDGGKGYTNKKLYVKTTGIDTIEDTIVFENHGFSDGEIVTYSTSGTPVTGLSTTSRYYVLKENNDRFRLANAGIGGTITTNYEKRDYVNLESTGTGYQVFSYPDITLTINAEIQSGVGTITATPIVRGSIENVYLYENGTGYGTTILNFHKRPQVSINIGKDAELTPIISSGRITNVVVSNSGQDYTSAPLLKVVSSTGVGARLRAIVSNDGKITGAVVINGGIGYASTNTTIEVTSNGKNAYIESSVRDLTVNKLSKFDSEIVIKNPDNAQGLEYGFIGYSTSIGSSVYGDSGSQHSPIIGWAFDGNPIYGPYAYSDPNDRNSSIKILTSGYTLSTSNVVDRPSTFTAGFFVEDYTYGNSGDLDEYNGRYERTPEFPNGVYAYHAGITTTSLVPNFPYFIGNSYKSIPLEQSLDQNFDFNNSNLVRNTLPYNVAEKYADNDFISEANETLIQNAIIESISKGSVTGLIVNEDGDGYRVGDVATFDNTGTNGGGISADVRSVVGKRINEVNTTIESYQSTKVVWENNSTISLHFDNKLHNIADGDRVVLSGSSTFVNGLTKSHLVGVSSETTTLIKQLSTNATAGVVTDIYVSRVPVSLSVGSTVAIGTEKLSVLNIFPSNKVVRASRGVTGTAHTASTELTVLDGKVSITANINYFDSRLNDKVYFHPTQSVGIGSTAGIAVSTSYEIGDLTSTISVPTQSIYLPNHPFKNAQQVTFARVTGSNPVSVSNTESSVAFDIPVSGDTQTLYVINKSKDYIGLTTEVGLTTSTSGLFFRSFAENGNENDYKYSLETNYEQLTATASKVVTTVSVSTSHLLQNGDNISLEVKPSQSVGIATTTAVVIKYNSLHNKLLVNPVGFTSVGVNTSISQLTISSHGFETGDKVFYNSSNTLISGLTTGSYYVYRIDDNTLNLTSTYYDAVSSPPSIVSFGSTGGSGQELSSINPRIEVIRNNNLVFNVSDSSLSGYKFNLYDDSAFNNKLVSTGSTTAFSVIGFGTVGVSTNATVTLDYSEELPTIIYYSLEKSGYITTADNSVKNSSQILFVDSPYKGSYNVFGVGTTTFNISLNEVPDFLSYNQDNTDVLEYSTTSLTAKGGVKSMRIVSGGSNYKKLPKFVSIASTDGEGVDIIPTSTTIGRIKEVSVDDAGFDFSADKTLKPEAFISPTINVINRDIITNVSIISGGENYVSTPDLVIVNPETGTPYPTGVLNAEIQGSAIFSVDIVESPRGLAQVKNKLYAVNNSNGIGIRSCFTSSSGIVTCIIATPILGFSTAPFTVGEKIFVENIRKYGTSGEGHNSTDHDYNFFTVSSFTNSNPAQVEFDISDYTSNPGIAVTDQGLYASIIKESDYPVFELTQVSANFIINEPILTVDGSNNVERDLIVTENLEDSIKVYGTYSLSKNDVIIGKYSGAQATINSIVDNKAIFKVDYSTRKNLGWADDIGKLSQDYQVLPDNDYFQNLSYTIKSPIEYEDLVNPVNRLLHTSGLKNFSDTEVIQTVNAGAASTSSSSTFALVDIISEERVDTINDFDLSIDIDTVTFSPTRSKFLKLQNKKLTDYIKCVSNRVLFIDNINSQFSNEGDADLYVDTLNYSINDGLNRFLIQVINPDSTQRQVSEILTLSSIDGDIITFERGNLFNTSEKVADISGNISEFGALTLRFTPTEQFNSDYDIKILRNNFSSDLAGIGTATVGFVNLTGSNVSVGVGSTSTIISTNTGTSEAFFINAEVENLTTNEINYVELFVDHNGTDTFVSEYYLDNNTSGEASTRFIGTFTSNINSGVISINFENTDSDSVFVRSKIVGFGTTAAGIGTYRFLSSGQPEGSETTVRLHSDFVNASGISTIFSVAKSDVTSIKSLVKVGYGNTSALHQVLIVHDDTDTYTLQYPFLSVENEIGIGTFGSKFDGSNLVLNFHPDAGITDVISIQAFSEFIQTDSDLDNTPLDLTYGSVRESLIVSGYDSINGNRVNKTEFTLKHNRVPIFQKTFNPSDTNVLNLGTGTFTIEDHFFKTGEKLTYNPASSFSGVTVNPIVDSGTSVGIATTVFAIRLNSTQFRLATSEANANAGTAITFSSAGNGNAHTLEMFKKMEKSIISINGVVQSPIAYSLITETLQNNGGSIGVSTNYMALSGISSILPGDVLKIEDEYIKVAAVGIGTTNSGPITGIGTFNLVKGIRGFVGTSASTHSDGLNADVYIGSFNIVGSNIHFTEPPRGNSGENLDSSNLPYPKASFGGRVYLRNDYTTNKIYDNISKNFTGVGATYRMSIGGANTTGIQTGSGVLFINDIFQTPSTSNNLGNNYSFSESVGITSVIFTGITDGGGLVISDYDVNANQLPRGGIIVSLGSTSGLGFAPLVGASVTAVVGAGGSIVSVGLGTTDIVGSGYNGIVSIGISVFESGHVGSAASITATVGAGGTLAFTVGSGGTGYTNPQIHVSEPSYENLEVIGVSRLGIGATTDTGTGLLLSLQVGAASTNVGIGSTLFEVTSFKVTRPGYGFRKGDVFKPVGLVTDRNLASPHNDFELTVLDTFTDSFSSWQFGELDFIDSIADLQNGTRTRFPLYYNNELISFEIDPNNSESSEIDINSILLIFVNGVIQEPGVHYRFEGGTSFIFSEAPDPSDNISIFFYRGTRGTDSFSVDVIETLKVGDIVEVGKNNAIPSTLSQNARTIYNIEASDKIETNMYNGVGIDETNFKPLSWTKQKVDLNISGELVYKSRDSIEAQVYPTAKIISGFSTTDTQIFVDDAQFFNYEENESAIVITNVDGLIITGNDPVAAAITAVVSAAGTISSLTIGNGGSGYTGASVSLSIAAPKSLGVGIGTTATATATITSGSITSVSITNPGFGYTTSNPPQVLAPTSNVSYENILDITTVNGFSGIVTGITTTSGIGTDLAIKFFLSADSFVGLDTGYPILISDTHVGNGVTSIDNNDTFTIGIGTTYIDNIYKIHALNLPLGAAGAIADITVNVLSTTNVTGISTSGVNVGRFSWGRLSGFTRSTSPISIGVTGLTVDSGLSTFPSIQRRGYGLRNNGSLRKDLG